MAEKHNKVVLEINNNEPMIDNNTNIPSPTDGNTVIKKNVNINNNEPINDNNNNEFSTDNTNVSSPIAGPSGIANECNELINDNNEPINDSDSSPTAGPSGTRVIQRKNWIKCNICNVFVSSQKLMQVHLSGKRHNIITRKINECPRNYNCELCKIKANSEKQLADHYTSKKHKGRVEELEHIDDIKFYCMYGTIIIILSWIIISYMLYFTFMFTE